MSGQTVSGHHYLKCEDGGGPWREASAYSVLTMEFHCRPWGLCTVSGKKSDATLPGPLMGLGTLRVLTLTTLGDLELLVSVC